MSTALLIAICFSTGFFFESMIGFGGGIIAYSLLGFFVDLKEMVIAGLYIATLSSCYIFYTDYKNLNKKILLSITPICLIGTIFGVFIFAKLSSASLALILGIILILVAIKSLFFPKYNFPKILKNKLLLLGGISQGAFGIGGPFVINAIKKDFKTKSNLRTTMAAYFAIFNIVRFIQLLIQGQISYDFFFEIWWVIIPIFIAIKLGHIIHLKISENFVIKAIAILTVFAGVEFISKSF